MNGHVVYINRTFTGNYDEDKAGLIEVAEAPTTAAGAYLHAQVVMNLHHRLTYGTPSAPNLPERTGLARKVFDELFPIAHFAALSFDASKDVVIRWHHGNQKFDATVDDQRPESARSKIRYLEVTTLQDRQDAELLTQLAEKETVCVEGQDDLSDHLRKVELLKAVLQKKGGKEYPPDTALLVYTDENRFQNFSFGLQPPPLDKKSSFASTLDEMKHLLTNFSKVFVYSKDEIYCEFSPSQEK